MISLTPWRISDPNRAVTRTHGATFRPIYILDRLGERVLFVGDTAADLLVARTIVRAVNAYARAYAKRKPANGGKRRAKKPVR